MLSLVLRSEAEYSLALRLTNSSLLPSFMAWGSWGVAWPPFHPITSLVISRLVEEELLSRGLCRRQSVIGGLYWYREEDDPSKSLLQSSCHECCCCCQCCQSQYKSQGLVSVKFIVRFRRVTTLACKFILPVVNRNKVCGPCTGNGIGGGALPLYTSNARCVEANEAREKRGFYHFINNCLCLPCASL